MRELQRDGYQEIKTPLLYNKALWEISGHWGKYRENMFLVLDNETGEHDFSLKPMNCPSHYLLYSVEEALVPRAAAALQHVRRAASQRGERRALRADARAAVPAGRLPHLPDGERRSQDEVHRLTKFILELLRDVRPHRDAQVRDAAGTADRRRRDVGPRRGGAARRRSRRPGCRTSSSRATARSTGRRSTSTSTDSIGRNWQLGTIQLDYAAPERFDLSYVGEDNTEHRPVVIHRAVSGSFERFIAILIEHFAGAFPVWLSPEQVRVLPIADAQADAPGRDATSARRRNPRQLDARNETLNYRIREARCRRCRTWRWSDSARPRPVPWRCALAGRGTSRRSFRWMRLSAGSKRTSLTGH